MVREAMFDVLLIIILWLIIVLGMVVYYHQKKKYDKTKCTLKVRARIVEKKEVSGPGRGFRIKIGGVFWPVFSVEIDGAEYFITDQKRAWSALEMEACQSLFLWVNPQNIAQFQYDDERLEFHKNIGGYIFVCISFMIITAIAVLSFS